MNRGKKFALTTFILTLTATLKLYAQGSAGECGDFADPEVGCPLDSWIYIFVLAALILVSIHLYRKQKASFTHF